MDLTGKIWNFLYRGISVRKKIFTSFFWIFFILVTIFIWVIIFQNHRKQDTLAADIAGRTRMLSVKMLLNANVSLSDDEFISKKGKEELQKSLEQLRTYYGILQDGGNDPWSESADHYIEKANDEKIIFHLREIEPVFLKYKTFAEVLIKEPKYIEQVIGINDTAIDSKKRSVVVVNNKVEKVLNPRIKQAIADLNHYSSENELLITNQKLANLYFKSLDDQDNYFLIYYAAFFIIGLGIILFNSILIFIYLVKPIDDISNAAEHIALGDINTSIKYNINDELGKIAGSINTLTGNLRKTNEFITKIGKGEFDAEYNVKTVDGLDDKDNLAFALVNMRNQLKTISEEDRKRNWVTEGLAKFGELLRKGSNDVETLSYDIIYNLVKYLDANQGSIFIVTEIEKNNEVLELKACYAWDRKKYRNMKVNMGEGLVGQAWQENETIYLSDFPENYIEITSGLGKANPKNLMIVPLKLNDKTFGIIEIASFKDFQKYQREFIEKIGESIASTVSSVKINSQTKKLLEETQQQSEEMRAQEEEMRQNMEEMQATQEEMTRKELETKKILIELKSSEEQARAQEEEIRQNMEEMQTTQEEMHRVQLEMKAMNTITNNVAIVSKTDIKGNITYVNEEFLKWSKYTREELIGKNHRILKSGHQADTLFVEMWKTISNGKVFRGEIKNKAKDGTYYWVDAVIAPILDDKGKPKEYIAQRFVIDEKKKKEEETQQMLEEMKAQEEEMRQNLEEMQTTQEEMLRVQLEMKAINTITNSVAIVSKTDLKGNITYVNEEFLKWSKYTREELIGKNHRILKSGHQADTLFVEMWKTISNGKVFRGEVKNKSKDGSFYWVDTVIAPILDDNGKIIEYIAQRFVINEKKKKEEEMQQLLEDMKQIQMESNEREVKLKYSVEKISELEKQQAGNIILEMECEELKNQLDALKKNKK